MKYAKFIENKLEFAPQNKGTVINYNTNVELMTADGYKLFVEAERPETNRIYHITYNETSNEIQEVIVYDETQEQANARELAEAKAEKYTENNEKANIKRYNQEFTVTLQDKVCVFDTNEKTQTDLLTAFAVCSSGETYDGWVCNNGVEIDLTLEDLMIVQVQFKTLSNVYPKWNEYKTLIDNAQTVEQVKAIIINYEVE